MRRRQPVYLKGDILAEMQVEARRRDTTVSQVAQAAWDRARATFLRFGDETDRALEEIGLR